MIPVARVHTAPGVEFTTIAPAGFRLLSAIEQAARALGLDLTITSACDGPHSGLVDPHHRGEAYDIRTHDIPPSKVAAVLDAIINACRDEDEGPALPVSSVTRSLATVRFFGFIEDAGAPNEHLHVQLRRGAAYIG
jgi:hypothetical protein